jgi:hypothetical protein
MTRRFFGCLLLCSAVGLPAGCAEPLDAKDPVWGREPCAHCAMLVSARRHAAQVLTQGGDHLFFDDLGCMIAYVAEGRSPVERAWVRDADADRWIAAESARYRSSPSTPMDYGFEATSSGDGLDLDQARRQVLARGGKQ